MRRRDVAGSTFIVREVLENHGLAGRNPLEQILRDPAIGGTDVAAEREKDIVLSQRVDTRPRVVVDRAGK